MTRKRLIRTLQSRLKKLSRYIRERLPVVARAVGHSVFVAENKSADNAQIYFMCALVGAIVLIQIGMHYQAAVNIYR